MFPIRAPRFPDLEQCRNQAEVEFIQSLHAHAEEAGWYLDYWAFWDDRIVLSLTVSDDTTPPGLVLRTLRVDFKDQTVTFGPDRTHQLTDELDVNDARTSSVSDRPAAELADRAAQWLAREWARPIDRHEWKRRDASGVQPQKYFLADSGEGLCARGQSSARVGRPNRIIRVHG